MEGATLAPLIASLLSFLSGYNDKLTRLFVVCASPLHCVYALWHNASYVIIDVTDIGPGKINIPKEKEE